MMIQYYILCTMGFKLTWFEFRRGIPVNYKCLFKFTNSSKLIYLSHLNFTVLEIWANWKSGHAHKLKQMLTQQLKKTAVVNNVESTIRLAETLSRLSLVRGPDHLYRIRNNITLFKIKLLNWFLNSFSLKKFVWTLFFTDTVDIIAGELIVVRIMKKKKKKITKAKNEYVNYFKV